MVRGVLPVGDEQPQAAGHFQCDDSSLFALHPVQTHEEILSATSGAGKSGSGVIHSQDERQSTFATEGSSNYLCAKRDEESRRSEGGGGGGGIGGGVAGYGEGQGFSGSK